MLYRFPVRDQEIKNGAQLIVRESQAESLFTKDRFRCVRPGRYSVDGGTRQSFPSGGLEARIYSPIKSEVYFVNTKHLPI